MASACPPHARQAFAIPLMREGMIGIEFQGPLERAFSVGQVPVIILQNGRQRGVGFPQRIVEFDRLQGGALSFGTGARWRCVSPNSKLVIGVGQASPDQGVRWLLVEGLVKKCEALPKTIFGSLIPVVAPLEVEAIGIRILCMAPA